MLSIIRFSDEEQAIEIANDIAFGLAAGVWTQSVKRAIKVSNAIRAGTVWVNTYRAVSFTSPFGGYKQSGIGRDLGMHALDGYSEIKNIFIAEP